MLQTLLKSIIRAIFGLNVTPHLGVSSLVGHVCLIFLPQSPSKSPTFTKKEIKLQISLLVMQYTYQTICGGLILWPFVRFSLQKISLDFLSIGSVPSSYLHYFVMELSWVRTFLAL